MRGGCRSVSFYRKVGAKERRVEAFAQWLAATSFSRGVARTFWLIPVLQSIHILAIAVVLSSVATRNPSGGRLMALLAILVFLLWCAIAVAGRWRAYTRVE